MITVTKYNDSGRIVESIKGNDCTVTNGEPIAPGLLDVDPHEKDDQGNDVKDKRGNKALMMSIEAVSV